MPYLIHNPDTTNATTYDLQFGVHTIGRGRDNAICLMDVSLSRHHARIEVGEQRITISDLQSSNHTFVNEVMIEQCELHHEDVIRCGRVVFKFINEALTPNYKSDAGLNQTSLIREFATDANYTFIQDLLAQPAQSHNSVLNLRQQDVNLRVVDKLKILLEVGKELSSAHELNKLLDKILDLLFKIMNLDRAAILLVNPKTNELEQKAVKFREAPLADENFYSKKITNTVRETGNALLISNAQTDDRFEGSESILCQAIHASMCAPLKPRDQIIGVLYVDNLSLSDIYSQEDVEFLSALANQAAIAIDNADLVKKMQEEAVIRNKLERFFPPAVSRKLREEGKINIVETEVTALFSDITRFTEMSSRMEPRQVISMLNEYFKLMVEEIVFPFEGTLEKYIGDALVAVWGAPYSRHDDVDRAVHAAIAMQWAVQHMKHQWRQEYGEPIYIHIGLNTGQVAAGNIGSSRLIQYTHIGDTMNVASRICSAAKGNEILIAQSTFDKLGDRSIPLEKLPPIIVKGKEEPLQLYRVNWQEVPSTVMSL